MPSTTHIVLSAIDQLHHTVGISHARMALDDDEHQKLTQIKAQRRHDEFIYGRFLLKHHIASHLNCKIKNITFQKTDTGKLYLEDTPLFFNLSHSGNFIALAINKDNEVGIDIEHPENKKNDILTIAKRFFCQEEYQTIKALPSVEQRDLFYTIWTTKEAILKATGCGISAGLDTINTLAINGNTPTTIFLDENKIGIDCQSWQNPQGLTDVYLSAAVINTSDESISFDGIK